MIACDDVRSAQLYKAAIAKVGEIYTGARLIAVDKKALFKHANMNFANLLLISKKKIRWQP